METHGAGRRRSALPRTRRQAIPAVTHLGDLACQSGRAVFLAPGILPPRKDHSQGRTLRFAAALIFHGKTWHLSGGRGGADPAEPVAR